MSNRLANKVAFITGGNSGIGLATAKAFVAEGANVVILARTQAKVDQAVAQIGKNAMGVVGNVADLPSLRKAFEQVKEVYGRIDVVFANAGVAPATPLIETGPEQLDRVFDVNFKGAFFTVQYALPLLAPEASVILVGSCISEMGTAGYSAYAASKAAVRSLARTLTPDLYVSRPAIIITSTCKHRDLEPKLNDFIEGLKPTLNENEPTLFATSLQS
ncbi:short chain dehydrogenase [Pseudovibrio ascidiaceicola]|uniref:Short chain dehydrogenase n=1 Tax=Pseudovibrio ascidiaceicola TaxID=285279 RepID=A0A1I4EMB6_9HYPH|nr:SDR family NAD(P)-dependent oxidoreductase [Pseudovibrio ascidiaceicola]SFL06439.1 short chain dehydrogenase [Pseudovibrio ascidiaceicola]